MSLHTMQTKSGHTFTPLNTDDVLDVVRDEMGDDIYDCLKEEIDFKHWEKEGEYEDLKVEFENYERSLDGWHSFVDDLSEEIEQLREKIEDNKLTKAKISIELYKIYEKMRKEL